MKIIADSANRIFFLNTQSDFSHTTLKTKNKQVQCFRQTSYDTKTTSNIIENKHIFLSKKSKGFVQKPYSTSQMYTSRKYLNTLVTGFIV